ncbi:MAG: hypothetical protein H0W25_15870 [Acidimicrobiia bacterium]|nr:hypothetical protein [Acidimicrobiia bacterium]
MPLSPRVRTGAFLLCAANGIAAVLHAPSLAGDERPAVVLPLVASPPVELALASAAPDEPSPAEPEPGSRRVVSTGYCLQGTTASGHPVGPGQVAMNDVPLGTVWTVDSGPLAGVVLVVTDRIGHGTDFDVWFGSCDAARRYGRRTIVVQQQA